ncbi:longitudinals lacking protein, isoforms H/M/V-like isoform X9 [Contarinia nasturtii]|uniref:longitudinals lacking protein, isoforms H/M/V-like isoform X9 n=1 Tax=Contarinia nasturtii TaxID=265458 RepID=UPI0012D44E7D|nr:longitudinals lacking protein, isoforms H/M/V-like isoform X9 [Contarinia nasturtii]
MDDDQQFCLRWNNHQSTLISVFDTLLENGTLVDCTLAAEGKFLKAHKVVLCACSPYFASLLSQQYDKHPIFILKDVKFQELRAMMDYMYRGEVNISQDQLAALLKAAESLQIKGLSDNRSGSSAKGVDNAQQQKQQVPVSGGAAGSAAKTGLTIEQNNKRPNAELPGDREGSTSPLSRKRKRVRRRSVDTNNAAATIDNHDQMSNSSSQSATQQAQPITSTPLTLSQITTATSAANVLNVTKKTDNNSNDDDDDDDDEEEPTIVRHKTRNTDGSNKDKIDSELLIEPKSEYEDGNDETVEDLTMADEELMEDMEQAGPSHGGEGSSQGYTQWQVDRSQDEVYLATQEAGQHRDAQGLMAKSLMPPPPPPPPPSSSQSSSPSVRSFSLKVKPMAQLVKDYNFGFPLRNVQQLDAIEQNILTDDKYASSLIGFLKSKPGSLRQNFPKLFTDDFTEQFNWDGIGKNKFAIRHRVFISHILYEVYKGKIEGAAMNIDKYGQEVRKAIRLSRIRKGRRQKVITERSKNKSFNYFHYP